MINVMFSGDFVSRLNVKTDPFDTTRTPSRNGIFEINRLIQTCTDWNGQLRTYP